MLLGPAVTPRGRTTPGGIQASPPTAGSPAEDLWPALCFPTRPAMRYSGESTGEHSHCSLSTSFHCRRRYYHSCVSTQDAEGFREGPTSGAPSTLTRLSAQQVVTHATTHTLLGAVIHPARSSCGMSRPPGGRFSWSSVGGPHARGHSCSEAGGGWL